MSSLAENRSRNRYINIFAYDHSRVMVTPNEANGNSDYINANYINGYGREKAYIAAQGPLPTTFNSFWQMVWEQGSDVIVMVTNETERGRMKCHRYWPDATETYGEIEVSKDSETTLKYHIERVFTLKHAPSGKQVSSMHGNGAILPRFPGALSMALRFNPLSTHHDPALRCWTHAQRTVTHFQYTQWPDHGAPNTTKEMLEFRETVRAKTNFDKGPVITHCSAGVGRTGTFVAIDRCGHGRMLRRSCSSFLAPNATRLLIVSLARVTVWRCMQAAGRC